MRIFIGDDNSPLVSPLVHVNDRWAFDSAGGTQELRARVIGENELATIGVCRAYVQAQYEYFAEDRNGDDVLEYAQQLASTKGARDGLFWHTGADEAASPLGAMVAEARASGYLKGSARQLNAAKPYHGYVFKILTSQGSHAPGGSHSYVINGHMIAGFALLAFPAKWNCSGAMTFMVSTNGRAYQKNLGEATATIAGNIDSFDPDERWTMVRD